MFKKSRNHLFRDSSAISLLRLAVLSLVSSSALGSLEMYMNRIFFLLRNRNLLYLLKHTYLLLSIFCHRLTIFTLVCCSALHTLTDNNNSSLVFTGYNNVFQTFEHFSPPMHYFTLNYIIIIYRIRDSVNGFT